LIRRAALCHDCRLYCFHSLCYCCLLPVILLVLLSAVFFLLNDALSFALYTLSLHDALPIYPDVPDNGKSLSMVNISLRLPSERRSEEHTSELQSRFDLVCRLLLEKKINLRITTSFCCFYDCFLVYSVALLAGLVLLATFIVS